MKTKNENQTDLVTTEDWLKQEVLDQTNKAIGKYVAIQLILIILLEAGLAAMLFLLQPNTLLAGAEARQNTTEEINQYSILNLINEERNRYEIRQLEFEPRLQQAAQNKAAYLLNNQLFTHNTADKKFSYWIREQGYEYLRVGENLAINFTKNQSVTDAWMDSDQHRRNILNPYYQDTGIAVLSGEFNGRETYLIVQVFGEPIRQLADSN